MCWQRLDQRNGGRPQYIVTAPVNGIASVSGWKYYLRLKASDCLEDAFTYAISLTAWVRYRYGIPPLNGGGGRLRCRMVRAM